MNFSVTGGNGNAVGGEISPGRAIHHLNGFPPWRMVSLGTPPLLEPMKLAIAREASSVRLGD